MTIIFIIVIISQLNFIDFTNMEKFMGDLYVFYVFKTLGMIKFDILILVFGLSILFTYFTMVRFIDFKKTRKDDLIEKYISENGLMNFVMDTSLLITSILLSTVSTLLLISFILISVDVSTIKKLYENKIIDENVVVKLIEEEKKKQKLAINKSGKFNVSYYYLNKIINEVEAEVALKPVESDIEKLESIIK